jgi:hypothetical protein
MQLPQARGPLSAAVLARLVGREPLDVGPVVPVVRERITEIDLLTDDDFHLALWALYELHYHGFDGVDSDLEWASELIRLRRMLEAPFEAELRRRCAPHVAATTGDDGDLPERLFDLAERFEGPSVAKFMHREATPEQFLEFLVHRSIYHLKESDPSSWVIPRITGKPKAALVELLYDEYGGGRPERLHATLFADSLESCGLMHAYGAYIDRVPGYTLASNNAMSLLGLNRRLRGAAMGHLGAFEATSSLPCRKFAGGARRLGLPEAVAFYFDEHVEADAVHEQLAFRDICAELVSTGQAEERDVVLGSAICLLMDTVVGERMLEDWEAGRSTLRAGAPAVPTQAARPSGQASQPSEPQRHSQPGQPQTPAATAAEPGVGAPDRAVAS